MNNVAEGCDILSSSPVCDADSSTAGIQDSAENKVAQCVGCKKDGKYIRTLMEYKTQILFRKRALVIFIIFHIYLGVGTPGDGTTIGKCPSSHSSYRCLSSGACNVCGLISGTHEGCVSTSTTPVCDADSTTSTIEDTAVEKIGVCKECTKSGLNLVSI